MAESRERVYILSQDYWGFDASSKNDTLNFYDNVWILKKNQYDGLPEEVRNQLYRCALFYHKSRVDNHGYTPLAIRDEGTTVKVRGPNRQGMVEMRTYDEGGQSPPYVVTDGTDTITMREADPSATDMSQLEAVGANTTPGTFLINTFIYEEKDILETINKLESEIGDVINQKSAEFVDPTSVAPTPSSYDESRPLTENPQNEGFSAEAEAAPESEALQVSDPMADNPPAETYSTANVKYDPSGVEGGYTPQDTFDNAAEGEVGHVNPMKTDKMGPKSATLKHRLSAKARSKARKAARAAKAMKFDAEVEATPLTEVVPMGEEMRQVMTTQAFGQAGGDYDHMIHYSADGIEQPGSDENFVMMPDAGVDILAPANAYGTNSAIVSGQGVPQWYGSAEVNEVVMSDNVDETHVQGVPIVPNTRGEDSAIGGRGVPQWYGAEQGYNDKMDESLGMRHRGPHSQSKHDRRDEAAAMDKMHTRMHRKYDDVMTMDAEVNPLVFEQVGGEDALGVGLPVIANSWGEDSAGGSGNGVPQMYGAEVNEVVYSDNVETTHVQGVPLVNNSWGNDSAIGGRGAPQWYGSAEAPESVAVQEARPDAYHPYEFVDEMSPEGEYMTGDEFMLLLSETIDGMGARYQKPSMFQSPMAMVAGGGILAYLGYMLASKK
ncbi:MAG: hypothetical protein CMN00_03110 [Rickettsiales bacterium]|nr:hypothetical protein [Rickettsiales bacterium]